MKTADYVDLIVGLKDFYLEKNASVETLRGAHLLDNFSDEKDQKVADLLAETFVSIDNTLNKTIASLETLAKESSSKLSEEDLDLLAKTAEELELSEDPHQVKIASVLDQILLSIGSSFSDKNAIKKAQEDEISRLRAKYRDEAIQELYNEKRQKQHDDMKTAEIDKAVEEGIKQYRPLEGSLSTRYCPDHPGASVIRIADYTYQCDLDKTIYNWTEGFSTMKGNKIPGGDISNQSQSIQQPSASVNFTTRENRLNY